jgi:hypothetical protein
VNLLPGVSRWGFVNLGVRAVGEPLWACNVGGKGGCVGEGEVVVFCGRADVRMPVGAPLTLGNAGWMILLCHKMGEMKG